METKLSRLARDLQNLPLASNVVSEGQTTPTTLPNLMTLPIFKSTAILMGAYGCFLILCSAVGFLAPPAATAAVSPGKATSMATLGLVSLGLAGGMTAAGSARGEEI